MLREAPVFLTGDRMDDCATNQTKRTKGKTRLRVGRRVMVVLLTLQ